ncbi:MAG: Cof-type HAD-IIB family hydrolase [Candidatus Rokuibacteriota bacterium]|nr:MAG: Cof-type HAD-IIB family hydrolase [Candidatus Rokubacteria bacterium]
MTFRLPASFPREVEALACDLDRTLIGENAVLLPRTKAALREACEAGLHVILVTGRMFQSVRRYALEAGLHEPLVCYQGAVVADPVTGEFLRHVPMPLEEAREAIGLVEGLGHTILVYVDDELYVARETPESDSYAGFQQLTVHPVGDLLAWLPKAPTKLVVVGDPAALDVLEADTKSHFGDRLYISKSLPYFLELASPNVTKAAGLDFLAERLGLSAERTVAFGDGENDVELLGWAGYAVAVANAHERVLALADFICPSVEEQGVAQVIEAFLGA